MSRFRKASGVPLNLIIAFPGPVATVAAGFAEGRKIISTAWPNTTWNADHLASGTPSAQLISYTLVSLIDAPRAMAAKDKTDTAESKDPRRRRAA